MSYTRIVRMDPIKPFCWKFNVLHGQNSNIVNDITHPTITNIKTTSCNMKMFPFVFADKYGNATSFHGFNCNFPLTSNDLEVT